MQERDTNDKLLDLRPQHARAPLEALPDLGDLDPAERDRELQYLRLISARTVKLPPDAYFTRARAQINARIKVSRVSWWERLVARLIPETVRPVPVAVATAAIAVAIMLSVVYYPYGNISDSPFSAENFGPYVSLADSYSEHITTGDERAISEQEMKEYREILLMSTAILGSPSSLSRSRSLAFSSK